MSNRKTKVVRLKIGTYQRDVLLQKTGEYDLRKAIESYVELNLPPDSVDDCSTFENHVIRLSDDVYKKLMTFHSVPYKALMLMMGVRRFDVEIKQGYRPMIITDSQFELLSSLGNGDVNEGLKALIGE